MKITPFRKIEPRGIEYIEMPVLAVHRIKYGSIEIQSTDYYQDVLMEIEPFTLVDFSILKPIKKNFPQSWKNIEDEYPVHLSSGRFIGKLSTRTMESFDLECGKYKGFVLHPCRDSKDGIIFAKACEAYLYQKGFEYLK